MAGFNALAAVQEGYDFAQGLRDQRTQRQAGNALAGGDYTGAKNALYQGGMLDAGQELERRQVAMDDRKAGLESKQRAEQLEFIKEAGTMLYRISQANGPQGVSAGFDHLTPIFRQMGADDNQLAELKRAIVSNPDVLTAIIGKADEELKVMSTPDGIVGVNPRSGDTRMLYQNQAKPISLDPDKNVYLPESAGDSPNALAAPSGGPRNMRNNNPGNIEDGPFAKSLPGYKGSDGRFAIFDNAQSGGGAQVALLQSYGSRGFNTVSKIINRWAPPSDNNPTPAYVQFVAQKLGVSPDQPLDLKNPQVAQAVAGAIAQFEGGSQSVSGIPGMRQIQQAQLKKEAAPSGYRYNPKGDLEFIPGGPADPANKAAGASGQPTEGERTAGFLASRLADSLKNLTSLTVKSPKAAKPGFMETVIGNHADQDAADLVRSGDRQAVLSNQLDALDAALTLGTGAAYTKEQIQNYARSYFPQLNDKPAAVQAKRQKFIAILKAAQIKAGRAAPPELAAAIAQAEAQLAADQNRAAKPTAKTSGNGWKVVGVR